MSSIHKGAGANFPDTSSSTLVSIIEYEELVFQKPLTSTRTCYSFAAQVTAKKPIFNTKFTAYGKCRY